MLRVRRLLCCRRLLGVAWVLGLGVPMAWAVTVEEALRYVPVQKDVEYDRPAAKEIAQCQIKSEQIGGISAWVVRGPAGEILRCFTDTNGDNRVDQWRYYASGIESYRDVDSNYNGKADQYRWLGLSGMRWGIDNDEDGQIDQWKEISPEEVTAEIVGAVRDKDERRFSNVLLTAAELDQLGLGERTASKIRRSLESAAQRFTRAVAAQRAVEPRAQWIHFGATRPGVLPANTDENSQDIYVYENVAAMLDTGQLTIGTLVRVGQQWRAIDIPTALMEEAERAESSAFLLTSTSTEPTVPVPAGDVITEEMQQLVDEVERVEKALAEAAPRDKLPLYEDQAKLLRQLAAKSRTQKDQAVWIRQLAETLSTAVQTGDYADGVEKLEALHQELQGQAPGAELTGYVRFRWLTADYARRLQSPQADFGKIQQWWLEQLDAYVNDYPQGSDTVEAMLQLAIAEEFSGNEESALKWYARIVAEGGTGLEAAKAQGAQKRLQSTGKSLDFRGKTIDGKSLDVAQLQGRVVLIHYWATWCEPCREDMATIAKLVTKYGNRFLPVGINLDADEAEVTAYLKQNPLPWPQIFETGGLDSRPAVELGVLTVPTMLLLDQNGQVVDRNAHISQVEEFLRKQLGE